MNEKWTVVGFRNVNFKDDSSGKQVTGFSLFLLRDTEDEKVTGQECQKIFISSQYVNYTPELGDEIVLLYNKYGKVGAVQVI